MYPCMHICMTMSLCEDRVRVRLLVCCMLYAKCSMWLPESELYSVLPCLIPFLYKLAPCFSLHHRLPQAAGRLVHVQAACTMLESFPLYRMPFRLEPWSRPPPGPMGAFTQMALHSRRPMCFTFPTAQLARSCEINSLLQVLP